VSDITRREFGSSQIELVKGDITAQDTEAIVNAANSSLLGGGGVDGAIHRSGGPEILAECQRLRATDYKDGLPPGQAVVTGAGRLLCRIVIHTVGPIWQGGQAGEAETLARCYANCLVRAQERGLSSIAFPSISTGAYGYPIALAAAVAMRAVSTALLLAPSPLLVRFVLFSDSDLSAYVRALQAL
jgi:O-acetyl-ADP-ribose deacetylase (regulator of RNase III)